MAFHEQVFFLVFTVKRTVDTIQNWMKSKTYNIISVVNRLGTNVGTGFCNHCKRPSYFRQSRTKNNFVPWCLVYGIFTYSLSTKVFKSFLRESNCSSKTQLCSTQPRYFISMFQWGGKMKQSLHHSIFQLEEILSSGAGSGQVSTMEPATSFH